MIDWEAIGDFITAVGFPVAVAVYLLVILHKTIREGFEKIFEKLTQIVTMLGERRRSD